MAIQRRPADPAPVEIEALGAAALLDVAFSGMAPTTRKAYLGEWARFGRWWKPLGLHDAAEQEPEATVRAFTLLEVSQARVIAVTYRKWMEGQGLQTATVARALGALNSITARLAWAGQCAWTLSMKVPRVQPYRDTKGPTQEEMHALLDACAEDGRPQGVRDLAILLCLFGRGLRRAEVCALEYPGDVRLGAEPQLYVLGKGRGQKEWLEISAPIAGALEGWLDVRGLEDGPLFLRFTKGGKLEPDRTMDGDGIYYVVTSRAEAVDVETRPHGLRHAAITKLAKAGVGVWDLSSWSRHSKTDTTRGYIDNLGESDRKLTALVTERGDEDGDS